MKKIFAILLSALALGGCENDGIPLSLIHI